jgi:hypoxanthine phosphoribosyltransferase
MVHTRKTRKARPAAPAPRRRARPRPAAADDPSGAAMTDAFALDRLGAPARMKRSPRKAVREIGWAAFGEVVRTLAARIHDEFKPDAVVGIAKGGVFVGGALAAAMNVEFYPVRIERRRRDAGVLPHAPASELPDLTRRKVLVVDDVASSGATLARARALARKAGAAEVRTAVLVVRPEGARPDYSALETEELVLFGWDYQLDGAGGGPGDPGEVGV